MHRLIIFIFLLFHASSICMGNERLLLANTDKDCSDTGDYSMSNVSINEPRIAQLLKGFAVKLDIEPAIPDNYVAIPKDESSSNMFDGVFWGPKEAIQDFLRDPKSNHEPIIFVKLSFTNDSREKTNRFASCRILL